MHCNPRRTDQETIADETAAKLERDPLQFRMEFLRLARAKAVLQARCRCGEMGKSMAVGFAQGLGLRMESRSFSIDAGKPISPSGIEQQCHGGIAEAISLVLKTGVNIVDGLSQDGSYNQHTFVKMNDFPKDVQIITMPNVGEAASGMGEVAMTVPSGAIANAYARGTGIKPRNSPLNAQPVYTPTPAGRLPVVPAFA